MTSCFAHSAKISSAQAESGRQWKSLNQSHLNPGPRGEGSYFIPNFAVKVKALHSFLRISFNFLQLPPMQVGWGSSEEFWRTYSAYTSGYQSVDRLSDIDEFEESFKYLSVVDKTKHYYTLCR